MEDRLRAYGAFEGCTAGDRRTILAQACVAVWHLTAGEEGWRLYRTHLGCPANWAPHERALDTMARLCPNVIAVVRGSIATWGLRFR